MKKDSLKPKSNPYTSLGCHGTEGYT